MSRRSEFLSAVFWAALGVIIIVASWRLDRLENLGINPWSVPGLTPGVVGVLMVVLAIALGLQARGLAEDLPAPPAPDEAAAQADGATPEVDTAHDSSPGRTLAAAVLCLLFAGVGLGHGLPFMLEGAVFVFLFTTVFSWSQWRIEGRIARKLLITLVIAVVSSSVISWLFESVFLVQLP